MRDINVKFIGFGKGFEIESCILYKAIAKHYNIVQSDNPDYIICTVFGKMYDYINYPQVRIMYSGENFIPDLNFVDYAWSSYPLMCMDRHLYFPGCIDEQGHCFELRHKDRNYSLDFLQTKKYFANFIASHESENGKRGIFFKQLSEYKRIESCGSYLNNMPNGKVVNWTDNSKTDFQKKCKFTLCFESTVHPGFVTEKITDAFFSDTIPIYYGSKTINDIFNPKAFINCADYDSFEQVIGKIIELDQNDQKYMHMLRQPIFNDPDFVNKRIAAADEFIINIFEQPLEHAYRRSRIYWPKRYEEKLLNMINGVNFEKNSDNFNNYSGTELIKAAFNKVFRKRL